MKLSARQICDLSEEWGETDLRLPGAVDRLARHLALSGHIQSPGHYVGACRRLARRQGVTLPTLDGRLVAAGYCRETPRAWVCEGRLAQFVAYWQRAAPRPAAVGSSYNPSPEQAYSAWRARLPPQVVRLGLWTREDVVALSSRTRRKLIRAAKALSRTSAGHASRTACYHRVSVGALSQLARLSPELQRALITVSGGLPERYQLDEDGELSGLRCQDLRWDLLAPIARAMAADKSGRLRVAWATGQRARALAREAMKREDTGADLWHYLGEDEICRWLWPCWPVQSLPEAQRLVREYGTDVEAVVRRAVLEPWDVLMAESAA